MRLVAHGIGITVSDTCVFSPDWRVHRVCVCVCDGVSPSLRPPSSRRFPFGIGEEPNLHQNDHGPSVLLRQRRPRDNRGCSGHGGREEVLAVLDIRVLGKKAAAVESPSAGGF